MTCYLCDRCRHKVRDLSSGTHVVCATRWSLAKIAVPDDGSDIGKLCMDYAPVQGALERREVMP